MVNFILKNMMLIDRGFLRLKAIITLPNFFFNKRKKLRNLIRRSVGGPPAPGPGVTSPGPRKVIERGLAISLLSKALADSYVAFQCDDTICLAVSLVGAAFDFIIFVGTIGKTPRFLAKKMVPPSIICKGYVHLCKEGKLPFIACKEFSVKASVFEGNDNVLDKMDAFERFNLSEYDNFMDNLDNHDPLNLKIEIDEAVKREAIDLERKAIDSIIDNKLLMQDEIKKKLEEQIEVNALLKEVERNWERP